MNHWRRGVRRNESLRLRAAGEVQLRLASERALQQPLVRRGGGDPQNSFEE